ncbi:hypothetical protein M3J43_27010, partial [Escherichia coli]|nr:hypothetical protein [Escherichia coli]
QEPRQPPAMPNCTEQAVTQLVGGRRPVILQQGGSGVLPRRFPVALKALPKPWQTLAKFILRAFLALAANTNHPRVGLGQKRAEVF